MDEIPRNRAPRVLTAFDHQLFAAHKAWQKVNERVQTWQSTAICTALVLVLVICLGVLYGNALLGNMARHVEDMQHENREMSYVVEKLRKRVDAIESNRQRAGL